MKKMEKLLAFALVFCMAFASSANVFATEALTLTEGTAEADGSLSSGDAYTPDTEIESYDLQGGDEFPAVEESAELTGNQNNVYTVTITTGSDEKEYDGQPLTSQEYTIDGLPEGCRVASIKMNGSITMPGSELNYIDDIQIVNANGENITNEFNIFCEPGLLTVTQNTAEIKIISQNGSWAYDGQEHTAGYQVFYTKDGHTDYYEVEKGNFPCTLPTGDRIIPVMTTSVKDVTGSDGVENTIDRLDFQNQSCYKNVEIKTGKLYVSKRYITITANRTNALYDGDEKGAAEGFTVKATGFDTGLPAGESVSQISITGRATNVGFYEGILVPANATIKDSDGKDTTSNYEISYAAGDLNIYMGGVNDYVTITPADVSATYDGQAHTAGTATAVDKLGNQLKIEYSADGNNWTENPTTITATNVADSKTVQIRVSSSAYEGYKYGSEKLEITKANIREHVKLTGTRVQVTYDGQAHAAGTATAKDDLNNSIKIEYSKDGVNWTENPASIAVTDANDWNNTVQVRASADNYDGYVTTSESLVVLPKNISSSDVTLTPKDVIVEYDGSAHAAGTATASDPLGNSLKIEYSVDNKNWIEDPTSITAKDVTDSKTVEVRVSCGKNSYGYQNYYGYKTGQTAQLKITPADINDYVTLTPTDVSQVYDGNSYTAGVASAVDKNDNPLTIEYSIDGEKWTDDPTTIIAKDVADSKIVQLRVSIAGTKHTDADEKDEGAADGRSILLSAGNETAASNYSGYVTGEEKLEITKAEAADYISLTTTDVSLTYDGSAHAAGTATAEDRLGNPLTIEYSTDGENWTIDPSTITATNPEDSMTVQVRVSSDNYSGYVTGTEKLTILASEKKNDKKDDPDTGKDTDKDKDHKGDAGQKTDDKDKKTSPAADTKTSTDANSNANNAAATTKAEAVSSKSNAVSTGDRAEVAGFTALAVIAGAAVLLLVRRKRHA